MDNLWRFLVYLVVLHLPGSSLWRQGGGGAGRGGGECPWDALFVVSQSAEGHAGCFGEINRSTPV